MRVARLALICCAFSAALEMMPGTTLADGTTGSIYGRVYLRGSGLPVCCLVVRVQSDSEPPQETLTRPDGSFSFVAVFPGAVAVTIGRQTTSVQVHANIESDETIFVTAATSANSR